MLNMPKSASAANINEVEALALSQEDTPQTHCAMDWHILGFRQRNRQE